MLPMLRPGDCRCLACSAQIAVARLDLLNRPHSGAWYRHALLFVLLLTLQHFPVLPASAQGVVSVVQQHTDQQLPQQQPQQRQWQRHRRLKGAQNDENASVLGLVPQSITVDGGASLLTVTFSNVQCVQGDATKLQLANKSLKAVWLQGTVSIDCSTATFNISAVRLLTGVYTARVTFNDQEVPVAKPLVLSVVAAPVVGWLSAPDSLPSTQQRFSVGANLHGTVLLPASVQVAFNDSCAEALDAAGLSWNSDAASNSQSMQVQLNCFPKGGALGLQLVGGSNVRVDKPSGRESVQIQPAQFVAQPVQILYRNNSAQPANASFVISRVDETAFASVLRYRFVVRSCSGCDADGCLSMLLLPNGTLTLPTSISSSTLVVPLNWTAISLAADVHFALELDQSSSNAAMQAPPDGTDDVVLHISGTPLGQCPPGSLLKVSSNTPRAPPTSGTKFGVDAALQQLEMRVRLPHTAAAFTSVKDLDPPFSPELTNFSLLVPYGVQSASLMVGTSHSKDVLHLASNCSSDGLSISSITNNSSSNSTAADILYLSSADLKPVNSSGPLKHFAVAVDGVTEACRMVLTVLRPLSSNSSSSGGGVDMPNSNSPALFPPPPCPPPMPGLDLGLGGGIDTVSESLAASRGAATALASTISNHLIEASPASDNGITTGSNITGDVVLPGYVHAGQYPVDLVPLSDPATLGLASLAYTDVDSARILPLCGQPPALLLAALSSKAAATAAARKGANNATVLSAALSILTQAIQGDDDRAVLSLQPSILPAGVTSTNILASIDYFSLYSPGFHLPGGKAGFGSDAGVGPVLQVLYNPQYMAECSAVQYIPVQRSLLCQGMQLVATSVSLYTKLQVDDGSLCCSAVMSDGNSTDASSSSSSGGGDDDSGGSVAVSGMLYSNASGSGSGVYCNSSADGSVSLPVIASAPDGRSTRFYTVLAYSVPADLNAIGNNSLNTSAYYADVAAGGSTSMVPSAAVARELVGDLYANRSKSWPPAAAQSNSCLVCPAGTYSAGLNAGACQMCPPGRATDAPLSSSCDMCPAGFFTYTWGSTVCRPCLMGTFAAKQGSWSCQLCSANTTSVDGSPACNLTMLPGSGGLDPSTGGGGSSSSGNAPRSSILLTFSVVLRISARKLFQLSASTTGIDAGYAGIVQVLITADTARTLRILPQAVQTTPLSQVDSSTFLVNVSATLPSDTSSDQAPDSSSNVSGGHDAPGNLSGDGVVETLVADSDKSFQRTTETTGALLQITNVQQRLVRFDPASNHLNLHAILWPTTFGTLLLAAFLLCNWGRVRRAKQLQAQRVGSVAWGVPTMTSGMDPFGLIMRHPSPSSWHVVDGHPEVELQELQGGPAGLAPARFRLRGAKTNAEVEGSSSVQDVTIANPFFGGEATQTRL